MKKICAVCILGLLTLGFSFANDSSDSGSTRQFSFALSEKLPLMHPQLVYESSDLQVATAISEGLFTYDPYSALPVPALAKKYTVSGKTWRFFLREDAFFENGDQITAETVKQSWLNLLSPGLDFPYSSLLDCIQGAFEYRTGQVKNQDSVAITVEDPYTLVVYLTEPTPHLSSILCNPAFAPVHKSQLEYAVNYQKNPKTITAKNIFIPISSGPFKVSKHSANQVVFTKNEKYWDKASVNLKEIVLRLDLSEDAQADAFNTGSLDWSKNATLDKIVGRGVINYSPLFGTSFFYFNVRDRNVASETVRQALLYALPYETLRENFLLQAETLVFPIAGYPSVAGISEENLTQAKNKIASLGLTDAEKRIVIQVYDTDFQKRIANVLKEAWEKIGMLVSIKTVKDFNPQTDLSNADYSVSLLSWIADFADPLAMLELFRGTSTLNCSGWVDEHFDNLLLKASTENEIKKRYEVLSEAEAYLLEKSVIIPLSFSFSLNVVDPSEIAGWYANPLDIHPFKFIRFKEKVLAPGFI